MLALAVGAGAVAAAGTLLVSRPMIHVLTPIDSVPSTAQLEAIYGGRDAVIETLQAGALGEIVIVGQDRPDIGVQLRSLRALTQYCDAPCSASPARDTIVAVATMPRYRDSRRGSDLLVLRAAIEALGLLRVPSDIALLLPHLSHPSRDIRAATAHALRDLGNTQAIMPLRARAEVEQVGQVRHAISDALRVLEQPGP